jgi:glycosyltransferase involved in cell wall biosynthesis
MKILIPIGSLYPAEIGGPSLTLYWLGKELNKRNINTFFITTSLFTGNKIKHDKIITTDLGKVIYIKTSNKYNIYRYILYTIKEIKKHNLIIITSIFAFSSLTFLIVSIIYNKKIILSPRGELDKKALVYKKFLKKIILILHKKIFKNNKNLFYHVTSNLECNHLLDVFQPHNKIILIPNYLQLPILINNFNTNFDYILYIGRFHPKKAVENLIDSIKLSKLFLKSDLKLKLAGFSNNIYGLMLRDKVNSLNLQNKIEFIGEVTGTEKELLYSKAFCTIVPSHTENFCNVVIESLSQGTPVIASRGTPWQSLEKNNCGYWVLNTPEILSKNIDIFLNMPKEDYILMRHSSRKFIEDNYDISNGVDIWINEFNKIYEN